MTRSFLMGRIYGVSGRDRHKLRFVEIGRASRVVITSQGRVPLTCGADPTLKVTLGWPVRPMAQLAPGRLDLAIGWLWIEATFPTR